ncbi:MAG: PEP-CTERM sorting domain-containing protein [Thiobacillaceae bacterium]
MSIRSTLIASGFIAASLISGTAHAVLQGRDLSGSEGSFDAYYDTDLNITWLANVNAPMAWADANTWAANLSITDGVNVYDNWRLPTTLQPDASCGDQYSGVSSGNNCIGSEMGHLFYAELGGTAGQSILTNTGPFTNLQAGTYWSATEYAPNSNYLAWYFSFGYGYQWADVKGGSFYALAVSPGDVAAVPEADTWAMLLVGLTLVGTATRRGRG